MASDRLCGPGTLVVLEVGAQFGPLIAAASGALLFGHRACALAVAAVLLAAGCRFTVGHLALASTRTVAIDRIAREAPGPRVTGRDCVHVVGILPVSHLPKVGRALDEALEQAGADVLGDVVVRFELLSVPFVYARACYAVEGVPQ